MDQISFADAEYAGKRKKTRREVFIAEMKLLVPWKALLKLIEPFYPGAGRGAQALSAGIDPIGSRFAVVQTFPSLTVSQTQPLTYPVAMRAMTQGAYQCDAQL